ncbi:hypothetical protein HBI56_230950 [Parastagonospora nodorum]|nr:hypothetical protein HBH43_233770 [Parastagonospora nodorum]KAH4284908.1 hypothetical protein HBI02_238920 [Parastagonospora nodorum]KAH4286395.1 hypothetical protein HBI01_239100 [Parastagonospora nodorum]KAH4319994.1 hypothetical protein HBI00_233740 [Parastagonospora nodorum]KAH4336292.1 hypothetical protein HBH98_231630 [Parastagonospora nodorum]
MSTEYPGIAHSLIPPILYINWAAVDQLKQFVSTEKSLELLSSSTGVTSWGLWYMWIVQYKLCACENEAFAVYVKRMRGLVFLGFLLPCITSTITLVHVFATVLNPRPSTDDYDAAEWISKHHGDSAGKSIYNLFWISGFASRLTSSGAMIIGFALILPGHRRDWRAVLPWLAARHDIEKFQVCFLKPCSSQSLRDSDQGFSLCCGLLLFACEVGPDMVAIIKAGPLAAVQWLKNWADEGLRVSEKSEPIVSDVGQPQRQIITPAPIITKPAAAMIRPRRNIV